MDKTVSIYKYKGIKVMLVTEDHTIAEVIAAFECVLKGSGFNYDGHVDIVNDTEE